MTVTISWHGVGDFSFDTGCLERYWDVLAHLRSFRIETRPRDDIKGQTGAVLANALLDDYNQLWRGLQKELGMLAVLRAWASLIVGYHGDDAIRERAWLDLRGPKHHDRAARRLYIISHLLYPEYIELLVKSFVDPWFPQSVLGELAAESARSADKVRALFTSTRLQFEERTKQRHPRPRFTSDSFRDADPASRRQPRTPPHTLAVPPCGGTPAEPSSPWSGRESPSPTSPLPPHTPTRAQSPVPASLSRPASPAPPSPEPSSSPLPPSSLTRTSSANSPLSRQGSAPTDSASTPTSIPALQPASPPSSIDDAPADASLLSPETSVSQGDGSPGSPSPVAPPSPECQTSSSPLSPPSRTRTSPVSSPLSRQVSGASSSASIPTSIPALQPASPPSSIDAAADDTPLLLSPERSSVNEGDGMPNARSSPSPSSSSSSPPSRSRYNLRSRTDTPPIQPSPPPAPSSSRHSQQKSSTTPDAIESGEDEHEQPLRRSTRRSTFASRNNGVKQEDKVNGRLLRREHRVNPWWPRNRDLWPLWNSIVGTRTAEEVKAPLDLSAFAAVEPPDEPCSICLGPFVDCIRLPCGHPFCRADAAGWLAEDLSCPLCRAAVVIPPPSSLSSPSHPSTTSSLSSTSSSSTRPSSAMSHSKEEKRAGRDPMRELQQKLEDVEREKTALFKEVASLRRWAQLVREMAPAEAQRVDERLHVDVDNG